MATTLKYKRLNKKDMKIFFPIALCLFIVSCKRSPVVVQDRANIKISELPAASALDTNDLFVISDAGAVSRSLKGRKIADAISDTVTAIRNEVDTAKVNLRAEISGGTGAWTKIGNLTALLASTDTVNVGYAGTEKLNVGGGGYFYQGNVTATGDGTTGGNINAYVLNLNQNAGSSGKVFSIGDDLYLGDNTNGWKKLSDLVVGGYLFKLTNTLYTIPSTYNLHLGGSTETTHKLLVTGTIGTTGDLSFTTASRSLRYNNGSFIRESTDATSLIDFGSSSGYMTLDVNNSTDMSFLNPGGYGMGTALYGTYLRAIDSTGHYGFLSFNGDSIRIYNPNAGLDYWIGTTITGGGGTGNVVSEAITGGSFAVFRTADTIVAMDALNNFNLLTAYGVGVGTVDVDNVYIQSTSSGNIELRNIVRVSDSLYLDYLELLGLPAGSVWYTNSPTGAVDSAATEPAYIGWEMEDLPTLEEYEADVKMINGHMERRVWYIDYETKELKSQYGWAGLGMMNTQSAYMIYHEITVRWMFEQNKKLDELAKQAEKNVYGEPLWRTIATAIIFSLFVILLIKKYYWLSKDEKERINNRK